MDKRRRGRRRMAWFGGVLMLAATGAGIWVLDQQRVSADAESALAEAARQDGLTANVPALPRAAETTPAAALPQAPTAAIAEAPAPPPAVTSAAGTEAAATTPAATPTTTAAAAPVEEIETEMAEPATAVPPPKATAARGSNSDAPRRAAEAAPARPPAKTVVADAGSSRARVGSPREACGSRTQFALYRCMQTQCAKSQWTQHPSCKRLRIRDEVD